MAEYDAIVAGVGAVGTAAAARLAARGERVLALDRYNVPNQLGSSHGVSRIIRLAYHEGPEYVPLLRRALEQWKRLDSRHQARLFFETGSLAMGPPGSEILEGAEETCRDRDIDHEVLSAAAVAERFPAYAFPDEYRAVWQPDGGMLDAEACLSAMLAEAQADGAEIRGREPVAEWELSRDGVSVHTDRGEYTGDVLVLASGAWTAQLLDGLGASLTVERHVHARYQPGGDPALFRPDRFPVFVTEVDGTDYYGLPIHRVPGLKVGAEIDENVAEGNRGVDPDAMDRQPTYEEGAVTRRFVDRQFAGGVGATLGLDACPITKTPDTDYIVDAYRDERVYVAAGMSGHGFKLANVIGEALADLATDGHTSLDIDRFALDRFA